MPTKRNYQGNQQNYDASNGEYEAGPETAFSSFSNPKKDESKVAQMGSDNFKSSFNKSFDNDDNVMDVVKKAGKGVDENTLRSMASDKYNTEIGEYIDSQFGDEPEEAEKKFIEKHGTEKEFQNKVIKASQLGSDDNATMSGEDLFQEFHGSTSKPSNKKDLLKNGKMFENRKFTNKELNHSEEIDDETFKSIIEQPLNDNQYLKKINKLDVDPSKSLMALTSPNSDKALLLDTQGFDYVRYGALIDKSQIDFKEEGEISTKLNDETSIHNRLTDLFVKDNKLTADEFKEKRALKNKYNKLLNKELYKGNKYYDASVNSILNDFIYNSKDMNDPKQRNNYLKNLDIWLDEAKENYALASKYKDDDEKAEEQGIIDTVEYVKDRIKNYKK